MRSIEGGGCGSCGFISPPITDHEPDTATGRGTDETRRLINPRIRFATRLRQPQESAGIRRDTVAVGEAGNWP
jgi:hypothetical protein